MKIQTKHSLLTLANLEETVSVRKAEISKLVETASCLKTEMLTIKKGKTVSNEIINKDKGSCEAELTSLRKEQKQREKEKFETSRNLESS